jgi:TRAP-type C4-dicarboxylate transport system permease small subunit
MELKESIVKQNNRHLKWKAFDRIEYSLMVICGLCLAGFTFSVFFDVLTRTIRHPWLWLQEATLGFFVWGLFLGGAVAVRRDEHFRLSVFTYSLKGKIRLIFEILNRIVILGVAISMVYYGYINFLSGFGSYMMPSMIPIAVLYSAIPVSGILITLFIVEQLGNGFQNRFEATKQLKTEQPNQESASGFVGVTSNE